MIIDLLAWVHLDWVSEADWRTPRLSRTELGLKFTDEVTSVRACVGVVVVFVTPGCLIWRERL